MHVPRDDREYLLALSPRVVDGLSQVRIAEVSGTGLEVTAPDGIAIGAQTGRSVVRHEHEALVPRLVHQRFQSRRGFLHAGDAEAPLDQRGVGHVAASHGMRPPDDQRDVAHGMPAVADRLHPAEGAGQLLEQERLDRAHQPYGRVVAQHLGQELRRNHAVVVAGNEQRRFGQPGDGARHLQSVLVPIAADVPDEDDRVVVRIVEIFDVGIVPAEMHVADDREAHRPEMRRPGLHRFKTTIRY